VPRTKKKPILEITKETINSIDYGDLEEFIKQVYNIKDYSFVLIQECGNDSSHEFTADGEIDEFDLEDAAKIRSGEIDLYQNSLLLNCLVADGYIPKGDYVIRVCW
jgi:hypothetical protein